MLNKWMLLQFSMENKIALEDILRVKQSVDQMDLVEFKTQWQNRSNDYAQLDQKERLKYMVMSIKILQAKSDLKRMVNSIKELSTHPESDKAIYYYLRADLWKFLDNFHYILLIEDLQDQDELQGVDLLEELTEIIAQDEELLRSCVIRLHKILEQTQMLKRDALRRGVKGLTYQLYQQLEQRFANIIQNLEPPGQTEETLPSDLIPEKVQETIQKYMLFSVARISIEKSGVLSIIQLLSEFPLPELQMHQEQLQTTLNALEQRVLYEPNIAPARNQCAYALIALLEILKMHQGLSVLLSRILDLCAYIQFPQPDISLEKELKELKGRVAEISQKKLRPIIEDILWKNPTYLGKLSHIRVAYPWCYRKDRENLLHISYIRQVVTSSFDRLESVPSLQFTHEEVSKSRLSEMVIESLGLLVNLEPSPRFLKLHAEETREIKQAQKSHMAADVLEKLLNNQYHTYKNHLKFLQDSLEYYQGLSEEIVL